MSILTEIFFDNYSGAFVFLCIVSILLVIFKAFLRKTSKSYKLPPGPIGLPVVGYLPFFGSKPHKKLLELSKKYGNVFSAKCGPKLVVFCNDWPSAEEALGKLETSNRPEGVFDAIPNSLGFGALNGKNWIEQRRFTSRVMKDVGLGGTQWEALLQEEIEEVVKIIQEHKGQEFDVREVLSSTFTNNIMTLMFGNRLSSGHPAVVYISDLVDCVTESFPALSPVNYLPNLCFILLKLGLYGSKKTLQKLYDFSSFIMKYVDKELKQGIDGETFVKIYQAEIEKQKKIPNTHMTKKSMYGNVQVLLFGGTDTTRTALTWLTLAMAQHPEVQEKVQKELDSVLGKDGRVDWAQRAKVPYTYTAIMEMLRWKTIVPINSLREANADFKLQGYDIPKGTVVIANQWSIHNDPKYWPEPQKYKPERFLQDGKLITSKIESYMPFSYGKRDCPGKLIALLEIFQYFVALMRNFTIMLPENGVVKYETVMGLTRPVKNVKLRFIPRDDAANNTYTK